MPAITGLQSLLFCWLYFTIKFYNRIKNRHVDSLFCTTCSLENKNILPRIYRRWHTRGIAAIAYRCHIRRYSSGFFSWSDFYTLALFFLLANLSSRKYEWDSRSFQCFLATCKRTDIIRWVKMARANSWVLCDLKIYPDISSYCNNPLSEHTFRRVETYEKKFSPHFPHTPSWYRKILIHV